MSKTIETDSLGFTIKINKVPETIDEAVAAFGGEANLIDSAVNSILQHNMKGDIRADICENLAKHLGVTRETKKVSSPTKADPNRQTEVNTQSDAEFVKQVLAQAGVTPAEVAADILKSEGYDFDAISVPRTAGAGRGPGKQMLAFAEKVIAAGQEQYDKTIALLESANPDAAKVERNEAGVPTAESLAALIKANQERAVKESQAALGLAA